MDGLTEIRSFCNIEYMQVLEEIIKVQNKGVVTIPKSLREAVGLEENSLARIKREKGRLVVEPVRTLPYPVRSYKDSELKEFFELDEKETKKLEVQGLL